MNSMQQQSFHPYTPRIVGGAVIVSICIVAVVIIGFSPERHSAAQSSAGNAGIKIGEPGSSEVQQGRIELRGVSSYIVPGDRSNSMSVVLDILDGTVAELDIIHQFTPGTRSERHIAEFDANIQGYVVGKSLSDIDPATIGGASYTSDAFFDALTMLE